MEREAVRAGRSSICSQLSCAGGRGVGVVGRWSTKLEWGDDKTMMNMWENCTAVGMCGWQAHVVVRLRSERAYTDAYATNTYVCMLPESRLIKATSKLSSCWPIMAQVSMWVVMSTCSTRLVEVQLSWHQRLRLWSSFPSTNYKVNANTSIFLMLYDIGHGWVRCG